MKFIDYSKQDLPKMITVQNPYSLLNRSFEVGLAEISIREKSGLLAYSPLGFGMLTGKYENGQNLINCLKKLCVVDYTKLCLMLS